MSRVGAALSALLLLTACARAASGPGSLPPSMAASVAPSTAPSVSLPPTPEASVIRCPNVEAGPSNRCLGTLKGGTYQTQIFSPALAYTVTAGWANMEDLPGNFLLLPIDATLGGVDAGKSDYLGVYKSVAAPGHCDGKASSTVPQTWQGLVDFLTTDPALAVAKLHAVTVSGLNGDEMEITMKDPAGDGCPDGVWADVYVGIGRSSLVHSVMANYALRIYLLKNGADTLAIEIADAPGGYYGDWPATAEGVIAKLVITP